MRNTILTLIMVPGLFWGLTGCSSMNSSFDCPMKGGTRCESLDQVNARIDRGEIGGADSVSWQTPETVWKDEKGAGFSGMPVRHPETVQHVWLAPYEDREGNYHAASSVYAVMEPGFWRNQSSRVVKEKTDV